MADSRDALLGRLVQRIAQFDDTQLLLLESALDNIDGNSSAPRIRISVPASEPTKKSIIESTLKLNGTLKLPAPSNSKSTAMAADSVSEVSDEQKDRLRELFERFNVHGSEMLNFDDFFALVKTGNPNFKEQHAHDLFRLADHDGRGEISFNNFLDYIFSNSRMKKAIKKTINVVDEEEEDARKKVLGRSINGRNGALRTVMEAGGDWGKLKWSERLEAVKEYDSGKAQAPTETAQPKQAPEKEKSKSAPKKSSGNKFADMSLEDLVTHSITNFDLNFAGTDVTVVRELQSVRDSLKVVNPPTKEFEITKFLAKGTAGFVFLAQRSSGSKVALKLVRMTQALGCIREWYVSKKMKALGARNVVYMDEVVYVLAKDEAPPIIEEGLRDAGPVPYYMCCVQEFMNGGSLESLQKDDRLTWDVMFKALEDISATLALMHANRVQHKDVKPENALLDMKGDSDMPQAVKLCDFGSSEIGDNQAGRADDIRRFGVMMYSLATDQLWTKNRLIREQHDVLVQRLSEVVAKNPSDVVKQLPEILENILNGEWDMQTIADLMLEMRQAYAAEDPCSSVSTIKLGK